MRTIQLRKNEDRRVKAGHLWIFSNEIANLSRDFKPGEIVDIISHGGGFLGRGYINPQSLIAVRILSRHKEIIDKGFFVERISRALALRRQMFPSEETFRAVYGEADGLPGLVIDKYADVLVIQISTLGMHARLAEILGALPEAGMAAETIVLRTDTPHAELEGFRGETRVLTGKAESPVRIEQDGLSFEVDIIQGQKTGFYLDQRENRQSARSLFRGLRVLDCFCYTGAWSVYSAKSEAEHVVGIDSSERAIEMAGRNAALNSLESACTFETADAFEKLSEFAHSGEEFDCVILDPPALVKSKRHLKQGEAAYEKINRLAMKLLKPGGILISCSCSHHISRELFSQILSSAARRCRKNLMVMEWRGQARDHPALLAMPETTYLKCAVMRVL